MLNTETQNKKYALEEYFKELNSVAIGFSSGVDSTLMLKVACDTLGCDNVIAVTARSAWFPSRELEEAIEFCKSLGVRHYFVDVSMDEIEGFKENPKNRCYICKLALFGGIIKLANKLNIENVCEGSNMDDLGDYRPGLQAIKELGVKSPLRQVELYKSEIREISKELNLPTWKKPSFACLASRFVYGELITVEKLKMVENAEDLLIRLGFEQFRVRMHGKMARIEVLPVDFTKLINHADEINNHLKNLGFSYVSMDLGGYKMGNMNNDILKN